MKSIKRKKVAVIVATIIALIAVSTLIGIGIVSIYTAKYLNLNVDEQMFSKSAKWSATSFYADDDYSDEEYNPVEVESSGSLKKVFYPLDEISPNLKNGIIAVEDKIFFEHHGVDIKRTVYAAINYLFGKGKAFGASTITQQVIKNMSGDNEPTLIRKISEIIRAANIEQSYSKEEILEVYLNIIPMSENIYGVGLASKTFFGKEPSELSAAECATLIGITNAPTAYNPYKNPEACREKRNTVLSVMYADGIIGEEEYELQRSSPLELIPKEKWEDKYDSWFTETVIEDICTDYARQYEISEAAARIILLGGGFKVYTTVDTIIQNILEKEFANSDIPVGYNGAMVITDAVSGELRAIVGGVGEKNANRLLNHALIPHTPASVLKPIALYAPLINEGKISWSTVFDDVPVSFSENDGEFTEYPRNSPGVYDGLITVAEAIRLSKNTVAVRLYEMRGKEQIFSDLTEKFGITTLVRNEKTDNGRILTDLSSSPLALGQLTKGISLRKLTEAYGVFTANGVLHKAISYIKVEDSDGNTVLQNDREESRIFSPSTAEIMNKLLLQVTESGTASRITLKNTVSTAGKTGTSGGGKDKLFIGYTPYYVAGIWCGGNKNGEAVPGDFSHLSLWDKIMTQIHESVNLGKDKRDFADGNLLYRPYCMDSGELYCDNCIFDPRGSRLDYGYFTKDNSPSTLCTRHVICAYDGESKGIARESCPSEVLVKVSLLDIPSRAFPKEIFITDAEYVWRACPSEEECSRDITADGSVPYFYPYLPVGEYAGISKRKRQFNASCILHGIEE